MNEHALLSASSAHRWICCPPSARLCSTIEEKEDIYTKEESIYAREGTLAHKICELKLRQKFIDVSMTKEEFNEQMEELKHDELYQKEMERYTNEYIDYITEVVYSKKEAPYITAEKKIDFSNYVPEGFGTADCIIIGNNTLHVIDFKYGKGVKVSVDYNEQLLLYALGAYVTYSFIYNIENIVMSIVQPRLDNICTQEITKEDLLMWGECVKPTALKAYKGEGEFSAGEHCKFCKAVGICKVKANEKLSLMGYENKETNLLTNDEIALILDKIKDLTTWAEKIKECALAKMLKGEKIKGYKLVQGKSSRNFTNTDEALEILQKAGYDKAILYETKPLTLSKLEKIIGKEEFNNLLNGLIVKKEGSPTITTIDDDREEYQVRTTAIEDFKEE